MHNLEEGSFFSISRLENPHRLVRTDGEQHAEFPIREGITRIGRSRGLDVCLTDTAVSRFHCYLLRIGDVVKVFDGNSKHPARLNGEIVNGQRLVSGNTLSVGRCTLVYEGPPPGSSSEGRADDSAP